VQSAFGFQGQKCSAGSRAIIVNDVYDRVTNRVVELASKLQVGAPDQGRHIDLGPVIDRDSFGKILGYIETGTQEGKLLLGGKAVETPEGGYFIEPTIFGDVPANARIAQEEIFGPVLALIRAKDYQQQPRPSGTGAARISRRQFVSEPQMYGRAGGSASVRRVQYEWHGQQSGRSRLSAAVHTGKINCGTPVIPRKIESLFS
jgi:hypothetical protein